MIETSARRTVPFIVGMTLGLLLGGGIATGIFLYLMEVERTQHVLALEQAALGLGLRGIDAAGNLIDPAKKEATEDAKINEIGKAYVDDLEKSRLLKMYRATTEAYQKNMPQEKFTALMETHAAVKSLEQFSREHHIRKLPKGKGYEFYFTGTERGGGVPTRYVNIALTLVKVDDEWLIDDLQLSHSEKK